MPRVRLVSRCTRAGARTKPFFRLIFFHRPSSDSTSRVTCSSVTPSATVRTMTPPASSGSTLRTISRSLERCSRLSIFRLTPMREA